MNILARTLAIAVLAAAATATAQVSLDPPAVGNTAQAARREGAQPIEAECRGDAWLTGRGIFVFNASGELVCGDDTVVSLADSDGYARRERFETGWRYVGVNTQATVSGTSIRLSLKGELSAFSGLGSGSLVLMGEGRYSIEDSPVEIPAQGVRIVFGAEEAPAAEQPVLISEVDAVPPREAPKLPKWMRASFLEAPGSRRPDEGAAPASDRPVGNADDVASTGNASEQEAAPQRPPARRPTSRRHPMYPVELPSRATHLVTKFDSAPSETVAATCSDYVELYGSGKFTLRIQGDLTISRAVKPVFPGGEPDKYPTTNGWRYPVVRGDVTVEGQGLWLSSKGSVEILGGEGVGTVLLVGSGTYQTPTYTGSIPSNGICVDFGTGAGGAGQSDRRPGEPWTP